MHRTLTGSRFRVSKGNDDERSAIGRAFETQDPQARVRRVRKAQPLRGWLARRSRRSVGRGWRARARVLLPGLRRA
jgi:hypothetical protein